MKYNYLLKLAHKFLSIAVEVKPMSEALKQPGINEQLEDIEEQSFSKYEDDYISSPFDIRDDVDQPGSTGFALVDDGKVLGYLYGYNFVHADNWDDLDPENENVRWFEEKNIADLESASKEGKIFYITNLAILPAYRAHFLSLALALKAAIKSQNYKYLVFNALSDSYKLLADENGNLRAPILKRFGIKPVAERYDSGVHDFLFKIE